MSEQHKSQLSLRTAAGDNLASRKWFSLGVVSGSAGVSLLEWETWILFVSSAVRTMPIDSNPSKSDAHFPTVVSPYPAPFHSIYNLFVSISVLFKLVT